MDEDDRSVRWWLWRASFEEVCDDMSVKREKMPLRGWSFAGGVQVLQSIP